MTRRELLRLAGWTAASALAAACAPAAPFPVPSVAPAAAATSQPSPPRTAAPATPKPTFPRGIYVVRPALGRPGGELEVQDGILPRKVDFGGIGYDVADDLVISAPGEGLVLHHADGRDERVAVPGLFAIGRPSLSPDAKQVAVQATETRPVPGAVPLFTIYVIEIATGKWRRIAPVPLTADGQSELPFWSPGGDRIAHWGTRDQCLVIRVRDAASGSDVLTIGRGGTAGCYQPERGILDGPRFHVSISRDSSRILIPGQLQVYDAKSGALLADVHQRALDALAAAGYKPDGRYPGQAGAGTFPLDGALSPDNRQIVFDGAVERAGQFGVLLCRIDLDGTGFTVLRVPVQVEPRHSNFHNFSQLLPRWR